MPKNGAFEDNNAILACLRGKEKTLALQGGEIVDFKVRQTIYQLNGKVATALPRKSLSSDGPRSMKRRSFSATSIPLRLGDFIGVPGFE